MRLGLVGRGPVGRYLATRLDPECWTGRELGLVDHLDAVILAVPDDAIAATAARVLDRFAPKALIHCSGATPISVLAAADQVAVWHPMRPFPVGEHVQSLDCVVGLRGDSIWVDRFVTWSREWGGTPVRLQEDQALQVHLACCYAAGATALMTSLARMHFLQAGMAAQDMKVAIRGLSHPALEAVLAHGAEAITGPARRADYGVMDAHRQLQEPSEAQLSTAILGQLKAFGLIPPS
ncbi:MAG: DUF2520 domain-containing protein [Myxococcota bacterium]|nr:DUF2520 domain-containing protein [Myxococcota bacterium]